MKDQAKLGKIKWQYIIVDEAHRYDFCYDAAIPMSPSIHFHDTAPTGISFPSVGNSSLMHYAHNFCI